jgi:hypothetical protein
MGAVTMVLRARLRQHWRSWLALSGLVALVGGLVIASAAAGRRTAAAFPGFVARHGYDAVVYSGRPHPELARFPQVAHLTQALLPFVVNPTCASCRKKIDDGSFAIFEVTPRELPRMVKLVSGRMPNQSNPHEVLASYTLARDNGVRLGSVIKASSLSKAQLPLTTNPTPGARPAGPLLSLRVVGFVVTEDEFPAGNGARYDLFPTAAFARTVNPRVPLLPVYFVRLRHGAADLNAFDTKARSLQVLGTDGLDSDAAAVQGSIRPQAVGWWVLAGLAALAGLAVLGQAVARQAASERADHPSLSAVGVRPRDFVVLGLAAALVVGLAGAAGAIALATLLSPLAPAGEARLADVTAGSVVFDPVILPLGALVTVVAVIALAVPPVVRQARLLASTPPPRPVPVRLVRAASAAGAPPSALIGIRSALERRPGGQPVPAATALLGTVMAVAALGATAVFGASLTHLISSPALYGVPYQVYFTNEGSGSGAEITGAVLTGLRRDPKIGRITLATVEEITVNGRHVRVFAVTPVRGRTLVSTVDGRVPRRGREIMLGAATMRATGARTGGLVEVMVTGPGGTRRQERFRVTGRAAFSPSFGTGGIGTGAVMTIGALIDAQCPAGPGRPACERGARRGIVYAVLTRSVAGPAGHAALDRHIRQYRSDVALPVKPTELVSFGESVNFPLLFGAMLTLFGAATLMHLLLVSVARRRRETGLLKVIGFVRKQIAAAVCWQATTVALVGLVVGVPLGVVAGRLVWRVFATTFGVVPVAVIQPWQLAVLAVAVLAAANVLAVVPALLAARSRPGELLRAE